jgi:hypothetical protein
MFGTDKLKAEISITDTEVECPVKECSTRVPRQRQRFKPLPQFFCRSHRIYISPSTFEYKHEKDNLLCQNSDEIDLLEAVKGKKRESRIARDNSEDALSWNVFRFLERSNNLLPWIELITGKREGSIEDIIYWSYSTAQRSQWDLLKSARREFGEANARGSEPDLAVVTARSIIFIEAKLTSSSKTSGDKKTLALRLANPKRYTTGGGRWFSTVFASDYAALLNDQKYELMRFWLLGTWMASQVNRDFCLVALVCRESEREIQQEFQRHLKDNSQRRFLRKTWEDIFKFTEVSTEPSEDRDRFTRYLTNKTVGYDHAGQLQKAFRL